MKTPRLEKIDLRHNRLNSKSPYLVYYKDELDQGWEVGYFHRPYRQMVRGEWIFCGESDREMDSIKGIFRIRKRPH